MATRKTRVCQHCGEILFRGNPTEIEFFTCTKCRDEIKQDNGLRTLLRSVLGGNLKATHHSYDLYTCPWHTDRDPSFVVYDSVCSCRAGCEINGKEWGDVYDFTQEFYGLDFQAAAELLSGKRNAEPLPRLIAPKQKKKRQLSMLDVERLHRNIEDALAWFESRCVSRFTAYEKKLGVDYHVSHKYIFRHGKRAGEEVWNQTRHFSIPNIVFGDVYYCKLRRDDSYSLEQLDLMDQVLVEAIREDVAEELGREPTNFELMQKIFPKRYPQKAGPKNAKLVFNAERCVRRTDAGLEYLHWPYITIHEGEIKAMAVEDAGYPALSNKEDENIARLVQNCKRVIYVRDNDDAGEAYALKHRNWIPHLEIVSPPQGFKAADDVVQAGLIHDWFGKLGLEPMELRKNEG